MGYYRRNENYSNTLWTIAAVFICCARLILAPFLLFPVGKPSGDEHIKTGFV